MADRPSLLKETEVELIDRELLAGDIVKRHPSDTMSGTILRCKETINLAQPIAWPNSEERVRRSGNYTTDSSKCVQGIDSTDLKQPWPYVEGDYVIYKDWVGKVLETYEDVIVRLSNGSVVKVADPEDLGSAIPTERFYPNDAIRTSKANLRTGTWIYGQYNPNIEPEGYVANVEINAIEVDWLSPARNDTGPEPDMMLNADVLLSGDVLVSESQINVDIGDRVRLRDLANAAVKYKDLQQISRTQTLGYDINVYTISSIRTELTVRWQDATITTHQSIDLIPMIDLDDEEVWPGELVATRESKNPNHSTTYEPKRVGIVQQCSSQERIVHVKWFEGELCVAADDDSVLFPGSWTGRLTSQVEAMSMYDTLTIPALSRRIGDFVNVIPFHDAAKTRPEFDMSRYSEVNTACDSATENNDWFGQVIDLGLDGLLTIRLGASIHVRDIRVPWECTVMVSELDGDDLDDSEPDDDMSIDMEEVTMDGYEDDAPWLDEQHRIVPEEEDAEWMQVFPQSFAAYEGELL